MSRLPSTRIRLALLAYNDAGEVLQLVPLGTLAKPLPIAELLEHVRQRIGTARVTEVLRFTARPKATESADGGNQ